MDLRLPARRVRHFELEVFRHLFASVAEEMGVTVQRSAYSPNIKERRDYSCAVFDRGGRMIAQAAHVPVHLGSMPMSVRSAIELYGDHLPGRADVVIVNDPYLGGTHLPDITTVSPVFVKRGSRDTHWGWVATRAHHADVGGISPGSMPLSTEIYHEGLIIPPMLLVKAGQIDEQLVEIICRNVRTPVERRGDLEAQLASHKVGEMRLAEFAARYGALELTRMTEDLFSYAERLTRTRLNMIPPGRYEFEDYLDNDGAGGAPVPIRVAITAGPDQLCVDFSGTGPAVRGSLNAPEAVTHSAVIYVVRCLVGADVPSNDGAFGAVDIHVPAGSVLNPSSPHAVAAGNVETSQRVVDVLWGALSEALPDVVPAASQGTMNNLVIGGQNPATNTPFTYYETIAGGAGGGPQQNGASGIHVAMTNTLNTPIEALEIAYPLRALRYELRANSGGRGVHRGGNGGRREMELLAPCTVTFMSERRIKAPWGLRGGSPGRKGRNRVRSDGRWRTVDGKITMDLEAGDAVAVESPGGGGWGSR